MKIKFVKLVPDDYVNSSRDQREVSKLKELGADVTIVAKKSVESVTDDSKGILRLTSRPLFPKIKNTFINRLVSFYTWGKTVKRLNPDIISCHDILCLTIGWIASLFMKQKPSLIYDSHEFEYARNENRTRLGKFLIFRLEHFMIKRSSFSIMVNDSIADAVMELHKLKERPVVVRNIPHYWNLDIDLLERRKKEFMKNYSIHKNESLVLYQGGVMKGRGLENAIAAIPLVNDARLVVMGGVIMHISKCSKARQNALALQIA